MASRRRTSGGGPAPKRRAAWRTLPDEARLEICAFLDLASLGRFELTGRRQVLELAWTSRAAGLPRGALADMPTKQFLVAHERTRRLFPRSWADARQDTLFPDITANPSFDEYAFSVVFAWLSRPDEIFRTVSFDYLTLLGNDVQHEFADYENHTFLIPAAVPGIDVLAGELRQLQHDPDRRESSWTPTCDVICTRKRDGAAVKIFRFDNWEQAAPDMFDESEARRANATFRESVCFLDDEAETAWNVIYEKPSGIPLAFNCTLWKRHLEATEFDDCWFFGLLKHACDEAAKGRLRMLSYGPGPLGE